VGQRQGRAAAAHPDLGVAKPATPDTEDCREVTGRGRKMLRFAAHAPSLSRMFADSLCRSRNIFPPAHLSRLQNGILSVQLFSTPITTGWWHSWLACKPMTQVEGSSLLHTPKKVMMKSLCDTWVAICHLRR
jgi:hypothetical protein